MSEAVNERRIASRNSELCIQLIFRLSHRLIVFNGMFILFNFEQIVIFVRALEHKKRVTKIHAVFCFIHFALKSKYYFESFKAD